VGTHDRSCPFYDRMEGWEAFLAVYRELIWDVQAIYEAHPDGRSPASERPE